MYFTHKKTEERTHKRVRDDISTQYFAELRFDLFGELLQTESIGWLRVSSQQWAGWTTLTYTEFTNNITTCRNHWT